METKRTTGEETISYWFDLPIDVAEFEEKLGVGAESGDYRIIEKVLPYADEVHEHANVYQLNELDFMYRQLSSDMQEEYSEIIDEDRRFNAQKMDKEFYSTLNDDTNNPTQDTAVTDSDMALLELIKSLSPEMKEQFLKQALQR